MLLILLLMKKNGENQGKKAVSCLSSFSSPKKKRLLN
jgi:hypothetical protein